MEHKVKESLTKAVQIHNVGPAKKMLEVDHYGKQRLVEIAETVLFFCIKQRLVPPFNLGGDACLKGKLK